MCGSNPGKIQPIKTTNCLLSNQVLANGFRDCRQIAAKKLSWPVFALFIHILRTQRGRRASMYSLQCTLTIKHILVDCVDLAPTRQRYFHVDSLTTLFDTVKFESVFDFLKEVHLCYNAFCYKAAKCNKYYKMRCNYMKCNKKLCNAFCNKLVKCNNLCSLGPFCMFITKCVVTNLTTQFVINLQNVISITKYAVII